MNDGVHMYGIEWTNPNREELLMRTTTEYNLKKGEAKRADWEVPRSGGVAPPDGPSPGTPGDPRPRIGARVWIEGVVMGRQEYGVDVRLPDGTIQSYSDLAVSSAEPHDDQLRCN